MRRTLAQHPSLVIALTSLALCVSPFALAATPKPLPLQPRPRDCGCSDLTRVETELRDQEYLENLFKQWGEYLPGSILTVDNVQTRAHDLLQLTFYGAQSQAPVKMGTGAHADLGTDFTDASCPLVMYQYKNGRPVMVADPPLKKGEKPSLLTMKPLLTPVDEAHYPAQGQCKALVHYGFEHEQHHQETCRDLFARNKLKLWNSPQYYAKDDAEAYRLGSEVLRKERDRLRQQCPKKKTGKWRGTLTYGLAEVTQGEKAINKGDHIVYLDATGMTRWGDHISKRLVATITADSLDEPVTVRYTANASSNHYSKYHLDLPKGECGWYKKTVFMHDAGDEEYKVLSARGTMTVPVSYNGHTFDMNLSPPEMKGTFTKRDWNVLTGNCGENLDENVHTSKHEQIVQPGFGVKLHADLNPDHPEQIAIDEVQKEDGGKRLIYVQLRLSRE